LALATNKVINLEETTRVALDARAEVMMVRALERNIGLGWGKKQR
jgi:hypothetical protein